MRHTTFRFALAPAPSQAALLARHAGASRFAYNQCLRLLTDALEARRIEPRTRVPWSRFDLINAINAWKRSETAGRIFVVAPDGTATKQVTGLSWRHEVSAQVFEEAAVDLARALSVYAQARNGEGRGRAGFPRRKRKGHCRDSFRLRNKTDSIRIGTDHPRSVSLPSIGTVRVHDDTRRLRRLLRPVAEVDADVGKQRPPGRARVLFATVTRHGDRWYVCLNVEATDLHPKRHHPPRDDQDHGGWVGLDRGLVAFAVAATASGTEVGRFHSPKPLQRGILGLRRRSQAFSRTQAHSHNRVKAARQLSRQHARIAAIRCSFLHEVSSRLVKTHDRLCLEDLTIANLIRNKHLSRSIADAGWAELARQLAYKQAWRGGQLMLADRWFASTRTCSSCGQVKDRLGFAERSFGCDACGLVIDRDRNAAANLAAWAERQHAQAPARQAGGRAINASGGEDVRRCPGNERTVPCEGGTDAHALLA
jgi:putative transposase